MNTMDSHEVCDELEEISAMLNFLQHATHRMIEGDEELIPNEKTIHGMHLFYRCIDIKLKRIAAHANAVHEQHQQNQKGAEQ